MAVTVASWLVTLAGVYLLIGVGIAVPFVVRGVNRIDASAAQGSWGFRLLIFPGSVALWPFVVRRWRRGGPPPAERNAHRDAARSSDNAS